MNEFCLIKQLDVINNFVACPVGRESRDASSISTIPRSSLSSRIPFNHSSRPASRKIKQAGMQKVDSTGKSHVSNEKQPLPLIPQQIKLLTRAETALKARRAFYWLENCFCKILATTAVSEPPNMIANLLKSCWKNFSINSGWVKRSRKQRACEMILQSFSPSICGW